MGFICDGCKIANCEEQCPYNRDVSESTGTCGYTPEQAALHGVIDRLRGQLQNCVNHLERAKRQWAIDGKYDKCIESANKALYETLGV